MITPYVTIPGRKEFERNKTGFGYMVYDIAKAVGVKHEVCVLATDSRGDSFCRDGVLFLRRSFWLMMKYFVRCIKWGDVRQLLKKYPVGKGARIRLWYYWAMSGYVRDLICTGCYDVVHIHGCAISDEIWMSICRKTGVRFLITLHGLNSFNDTISLEAAGKQYERDFLQRVVNYEFPITVISTGIKRIIERAYGIVECKNIMVVCNSFSFDDIDNSISLCDVRKQYNIPSKAKVLLYVGNISDNKNQRQLVEACDLLSDDLRRNTWLLFCGSPSKDGNFERMVQRSPNKDRIMLCGVIDKKSIGDYYRSANGVVLLSYSEGFGLSLIEGMHFGIPCAMFRDMDAFEDIYDEKAVVAIDNRDNMMVSVALEDLLTRDWDRQAIIANSERFSSQEMANKYIKAYKYE